ncbi:MAG: Metallophos protein [Patescibacteria group bacterium]|nr:Metallophos protein [Patescibacteria group bacterium]
MKRTWLYLIILIIAAFALAEIFAYQKNIVGLKDNFHKEAVLGISDGDPFDGNFSFAVIGDTQRFRAENAGGSLQTAAREISKIDPNFIVATGDLVSSCDGSLRCEKKFSDWLGILGPLAPRTYAAMGNHDRTSGKKSDAVWRKAFEFPQNGPENYGESVYSFDHENSHFVVLNSEKPGEHTVNKIQRDWLERDLLENGKENTFVFFHEPAFPVSSKIGESLDEDEEERDALWEILKRHNVAAVFNGHEHIASRRQVDGIYQFIIGNTDAYDHDFPGSGVAEYAYQGKHFGIVEVSGKNITVKIYSVDGKILDTFKLPGS